MKIALLGATSQIAKDLISSFNEEKKDIFLNLFTRRPDGLKIWMGANKISEKKYCIKNHNSFNEEKYDAIINFIGVGDPQEAINMGPEIFDVTLQYDQIVLEYLKLNPRCKYIFISSGAVYGDAFNEPVNENSKASIPINNLQPWNWYSIAKLYAEARHRALIDLCIVDIRIFNYFSQSQNLNSRYLITDILRSIRDGKTISLSKENIVRDYLGPGDFYQMVSRVLQISTLNIAIDCFTKSPIDKLSLLEAMQSTFGLKYEFVNNNKNSLNATGHKSYYYSKNFKAKDLGYEPKYSSLENLIHQIKIIMS